MILFLKKYSLPICVLLLLSIAGMSLYFPSAAPVLGMVVLLFSLTVSTHSIFEKHKQAENPRPKIVKDILILVFTLLLVIFLGGLAGLFAAQYAWSQGWGMATTFVLVILASCAVGYTVNKIAGKIIKA